MLDLAGQDEWMNGVLDHLCAHDYRLKWAPEDGEINEMQFPPDTKFEIRALAGGGRARYLSITETPHNIKSLWVSGEETFCFLGTWRPEWGSNPRSLTFQAGNFNYCTRAPALGWTRWTWYFFVVSKCLLCMWTFRIIAMSNRDIKAPVFKERVADYDWLWYWWTMRI